MDGDGCIIIRTSISYVEGNPEDNEYPFPDFRLRVEGDYKGRFKVKKYILGVYERHKAYLLANPDKQETELRVLVEDILKG